MTPAPFVAHMMAHGVYLDQGVEKGRLFEDLSLVRHQWEAQQLTDAAYATVFFLLWQIDQHGARFASRMHRHQSKPEPKTARETLLQSGAPRLRLRGLKTGACAHHGAWVRNIFQQSTQERF